MKEIYLFNDVSRNNVSGCPGLGKYPFINFPFRFVTCKFYKLGTALNSFFFKIRLSFFVSLFLRRV